jgi:pyruvate dehydrogenase E2 component (dihydrolipoamide acetyltransferase)
MSAASETLGVNVPDIGDFGEVPVIEILVAIGDTVAPEDPLITLESDKATMDVPSPVAGTVKGIHVKVGDSVSEGTLILDLDADSGSADAPAPDSGQAETAAATPEVVQEKTGESPVAEPEAVAAQSDLPSTPSTAATNGSSNGKSNGNGAVYASPAVRKIARELKVDLHAITGTGRKGRLTPQDVRSANTGAQHKTAGAPGNGAVAGLDLPAWPTVDFEKFGPIERVPRSRIQKISAPALARNWVMIPHVTHNDEADITELEAWRKQLNAELAKDGVKFTMVSFLVAASVVALKAFPTFNSALDGEDLVLRKYFNIGFAADTPGGLVVPVIKDADRKGLLDIAIDLAELSGKAREGKLGPAEMNGGTFTISSLGGIGGTSFTPIINAPEVAILGVTRSSVKPIWDEGTGTFVPRLMVPLSLSYDHRVIDGASAARFMALLVNVLSDLRRALL